MLRWIDPEKNQYSIDAPIYEKRDQVDEIIDSFKQKDPFFTCNFQADQFNYLEELDNDKIKKTLNN